jgi:hypothetical protein
MGSTAISQTSTKINLAKDASIPKEMAAVKDHIGPLLHAKGGFDDIDDALRALKKNPELFLSKHIVDVVGNGADGYRPMKLVFRKDGIFRLVDNVEADEIGADVPIHNIHMLSGWGGDKEEFKVEEIKGDLLPNKAIEIKKKTTEEATEKVTIMSTAKLSGCSFVMYAAPPDKSIFCAHIQPRDVAGFVGCDKGEAFQAYIKKCGKVKMEWPGTLKVWGACDYNADSMEGCDNNCTVIGFVKDNKWTIYAHVWNPGKKQIVGLPQILYPWSEEEKQKNK